MNLTLNRHAGHREATEKLQELSARRNELQAEQRSLMGELSKPRTNGIQEQAAALLLGSLAPSATAVVTRDQLAQVRHELRVVTEAIEMQQKVVERERRISSTKILDEARPKYKAIVKKMAGILHALRDAAVEEYEFRNALCDSDVSIEQDFILPYGDCGAPANGNERHDSIAHWHKQAREAGMI